MNNVGNLVLSLREGESFVTAGPCRVTFIAYRGRGQISVGIEATREVAIHRVKGGDARPYTNTT